MLTFKLISEAFTSNYGSRVISNLLGQVFMRIRLVSIFSFVEGCPRQGDLSFADPLASRACMEASWIPLLIGLHADSVMGVG